MTYIIKLHINITPLRLVRTMVLIRVLPISVLFLPSRLFKNRISSLFYTSLSYLGINTLFSLIPNSPDNAVTLSLAFFLTLFLVKTQLMKKSMFSPAK